MTDLTHYSALIQTTAQTYGLDADLLEAQVLVESSGLADAFRYEPEFYARYLKGNLTAASVQYGPLGACSYGLLQIMLETAMEEGFTGRPEDLFDPALGLQLGAQHLHGLLVWANQDYRRALAAYNGGKGSAPVGMAFPSGPQHYVDRIYAMVGRAS